MTYNVQVNLFELSNHRSAEEVVLSDECVQDRTRYVMSELLHSETDQCILSGSEKPQAFFRIDLKTTLSM